MKKKAAVDKVKNEINDKFENETDKSKAFISYIYYKIIKSLKGEHALALAENLRKDLKTKSPKFIVPVISIMPLKMFWNRHERVTSNIR